jgi:hypothetical protein
LFLVIVSRSVCSGFQARREAGLFFIPLLFYLATESQGTRQGGLLLGKPTTLFCSTRKGIKKQNNHEMVDIRLHQAAQQD